MNPGLWTLATVRDFNSNGDTIELKGQWRTTPATVGGNTQNIYAGSRVQDEIIGIEKELRHS